MPSSRTKFRPKLLRVALALAGLFALAFLCVWLLRIKIASGYIESLAADLGAKSVQFEITQLDFSTLSVRDLSFTVSDQSVAAQTITASYSLKEIWRQRKIRSVALEGLHLTIASLPDSTESSDSPSELPQNKSELLELLDLSAFSPFPFDRIQISDSSVSITPYDLEIAFSALLEAPTPDSLSIDLQANSPDLQSEISGLLATADRSTLQATISVKNPTKTLDSLAPDWRTALPEELSFSTGPIALRATLSPNEPLSFSTTIQSPQFGYDVFVASFDAIQVAATADNANAINWTASLSPQSIQYETFEVAADTEIALAGKLADLQLLTLSTQSPLAWSYDTDFISGKSAANLAYDLDATSMPLTGTVHNEALTLSDFSLQPFELAFEADLVTYHLSLPDLFLSQTTSPLATASNAALFVPEDESLPITFDWTTVLNPNAYPDLKDITLPKSANLKVHAEVGETTTQTQISLAPPERSQLLVIPDTASLSGNLRIDATLVENESTETYALDFATALSDASLRFDEFSLEGLSVSLKTRIDETPTSVLDAESIDVEDLFANQISSLSTEVEWQANQISASGISAQWSGGTVSFSSEKGVQVAKAETMLGVVTYDAVRLEQLFLDSSLKGDFAQYDGATTLDLLFEGVPIHIDVSHQLTDAINAPYLSGNYTLTPVTFNQTDLPGRLVPEIVGASASATLEANGAYWLTSDSFNTNPTVSLSNASFDYPPSKIHADGISFNIAFESIDPLATATAPATLRVASVHAGDFQAKGFASDLQIADGKLLRLRDTEVSLMGGHASLAPLEIPIDGGDFRGHVSLQRIDLAELSNYVDIFRGRMTGKLSGDLPFSFRGGAFNLERGALDLPEGETATLSYPAEGLLTGDKSKQAAQKPSFSDKLLTFLEIEPEAIAEEAMSDVTIDSFHAELFPEDTPSTPLRIRISGTAHSEKANLPIVIDTSVHGTLSELYNFLIRLNSI